MDIKISILDDNEDFLKILRLLVEDCFEIDICTSDVNELIEKITQPSVIIIDWFLKHGVTGLEVMKKVLDKNPLCHPIYVSDMANVDNLKKIINHGWGSFFIEKTDTDFAKQLNEKIIQARRLLIAKIGMANKEFQRNEQLRQQIEETLKSF